MNKEKLKNQNFPFQQKMSTIAQDAFGFNLVMYT